jgi:hypothetical protein
VATLVVDQDSGAALDAEALAEVKARRADAEVRLHRYQEAIGAGVEPAALVEAINQAQADRVAAQAQITNAGKGDALDVAEVYAMIDARISHEASRRHAGGTRVTSCVSISANARMADSGWPGIPRYRWRTCSPGTGPRIDRSATRGRCRPWCAAPRSRFQVRAWGTCGR